MSTTASQNYNNWPSAAGNLIDSWCGIYLNIRPQNCSRTEPFKWWQICGWMLMIFPVFDSCSLDQNYRFLRADQSSSSICRILSKLHCELVEPICRCQLEVHLAGTSMTRTRLTSNEWNYTIQLFERVIRSAMAELGWNSKLFRNSTRISFLGAIRNCCRYQIVCVVALHHERVEEGSILRHLHLLLEP